MTLLQTSLEHGMGATLSVGCWSPYGHRTRLLRPPQLAASLHRQRQRFLSVSRNPQGRPRYWNEPESRLFALRCNTSWIVRDFRARPMECI
jgi:hypothetical protein